jgi:hypothetical protein
MGSTTATRRASARAEKSGVAPGEFRAALDEALALADADDRVGPLIRAAGLRMRFEFPDASMVLNLAAASGAGHIRWAFSDEGDWAPKLELTMSSAVANRYLQGRESLAIAIARGQVSVVGESRTAVLYLPATRLLCEPYRKVIARGYPKLVVAH